MRRLVLLPFVALIGAPALLAQSSTGAVGRPLPQKSAPARTAPAQTTPAPSNGNNATPNNATPNNATPGQTVPSTPGTPGGTETGAGVQPGGGVQPMAPGTRIQEVPNQNPSVPIGQAVNPNASTNITNVPQAGAGQTTGTGSPFSGPGVGFADGGVSGGAISDGGSPGQAGPAGPGPGIGMSDGGTGVGFGGADAGNLGVAGPQ